MKIIDKSLLGEVKNMKDGEFGLFEYVDCGRCFQDKFIAVGGEMFFGTESCYQDVKTGKALDCFYRYDENNECLIAVVNLDGSGEVK